MSDPTAWGPALWRVIHTFSFNYARLIGDDGRTTRKYPRAARHFFEAIGYLMPCATCAEWYRAWLAEHPVASYSADRDSLSRWTYAMHCAVNAKLGKPNAVTYEAATRRYQRAATAPPVVPFAAALASSLHAAVPSTPGAPRPPDGGGLRRLLSMDAAAR